MALLLLAAVACSDGDPSSENVGSVASDPTPVAFSIPGSTPSYHTESGVFYAVPASTPVPIPTPSYLSEVIPPCTPIDGFTGDTCTPSLTSLSADASYDFGTEPFDLGYFLGKGAYTPLEGGHLVVRATTIPGTARCELGGQLFRFPAYVEDSVLELRHQSVNCYADVRVNEYLIGSGPASLTLLFGLMVGGNEELRRSAERAFVGGLSSIPTRSDWRIHPGGIGGWEAVFFIGPSLSAAVEVFEVTASWHLQEQSDGTVKAIHPHADVWSKYPEIYAWHRDTLLEPTLATLKTGLVTANNARMEANGGRTAPPSETDGLATNASWPMLVTDANDLRQHYIDIGEYDDPNGPPETPLLPCGVGAVSAQVNNYGLMQDCSTLLAIEDQLRGTASLNWAVDEAIADWDGVTVSSGDDDKRVVTLDLEDESLTGTLSNRLGELTSLTTLKLANNSLSGRIPASLADLDLDELKLAGNSLAGCIPAGLRDIDDHDLGSLGLGDCLTPPPDADRTLEFTSSAYTFSVGEDAAVGTSVGVVQASDTNPTRTLTYTIIVGNAAGKFVRRREPAEPSRWRLNWTTRPGSSTP